MKTIIKIVALAAVLTGFTGIGLITEAAEKAGARFESGDDNGNKRRGRRNRSDDDDSNSNGNTNSNRNANSNNSVPGISSEKARRIALERVAGTVVKEEFERKNGRAIYEFYIRQASGEIFEVYVDAETGKVVKVESRD